MKLSLRCFLIVLALCSFMTPEQRQSWLNHFKGKIAEVGDDPAIEQISMLTSLVASPSESEEAAIVRELAWQKLLTIPDFPERIRDHILETKKKWKAKAVPYVDYSRARGWNLSSFGKLPVPGCVGVLGEFLYDEEWPLGNSIRGMVNGGPPTADIAMKALGQLIENPPVQGDPENYQLHDVATWQLWYEQVKAGTRTFRFKGDPQEYTLAGPVSEARTPQANRTSKAPATPDPAAAEATETSRPRMAPVALALALALCAVAVWRVLRGRRA